MEPNLFKFVYQHSKRQQAIVLLLTSLSWPALYFTLVLPKLIIDDTINVAAGDFVPVDVFGIQLGHVEYLMALSFAFLFTVVLGGGVLKYYINVLRGQLGERVLRRLRYMLYVRVLQFRLPQFRKMSQGEIIPMITAEAEPIGGFAGEAFGLPAYQGGLLFVYLFFIFQQDLLLGLAAISSYPLQMYIIPKMQQKVNQLGKRRVRKLRVIADRVGETVSGISDVHAHNTARWHLSDMSNQLSDLYFIRYEIYRRKFFIKFINNFLNQITPFLFYSIGGYLVIQGDLSAGSLVAVLAAYKDLASPWRELLNFYQRVEDMRVKYEQIVSQFQPDDIQEADELTADDRLQGPLPDDLVLINVVVHDDTGTPIVDGLSATLPFSSMVAVLGPPGGGKEVLIQLAGRQLVPATGSIRLGPYDYATLPEATTGRRIVYVGPESHIFTGTLRENLYYGLLRLPAVSNPAAIEKRIATYEARRTGNSVEPIDADWVDYAAAGASDMTSLEHVAMEALAVAEMTTDVYQLGLLGTIDPDARPEAADRILAARTAVRDRLAQDSDAAALIEPFDVERYNENATVAENILFGVPLSADLQGDALARHPFVKQVLEEAGLVDAFVETGVRVAETMIEIFADLPAGHPFFEQFSFIASDELPSFQPIVTKANRDGIAALDEGERSRFSALPFMLVPSRHRLGLIDAAMREKILEARRLFARTLPDDLKDAISFFDAHGYNRGATVQDNILFGRGRYGISIGPERLLDLIGQIVEQTGLKETIIAVGLDHSVGVGGSRLSVSQRHRLALARAVLKNPDMLILNDVVSALDVDTQERVVANVCERFYDRALIWALPRDRLADGFHSLMVVNQGRVSVVQSYNDLIKNREGASDR